MQETMQDSPTQGMEIAHQKPLWTPESLKSKIESPAMRAYIVKRLMYRGAAPDVAEDLAQEVWLKAQQAIAQGKVDGTRMVKIESWLEPIIVHSLIDNKAARDRRGGIPEDLDTHLGQLPEPNLDPEAELIHRRENKEMLGLITHLPEDFRQTLLFHLDGHSNIEIAELTKVSALTVGTRIFRAKEMLRDLQKKQGKK